MSHSSRSVVPSISVREWLGDTEGECGGDESVGVGRGCRSLDEERWSCSEPLREYVGKGGSLGDVQFY